MQYNVTKVEGYCLRVRDIVAEELGISEANSFISIKQIKGLLNEFCLGHNENGYPIINDEIHENLCDSILMRMQNVGIAKLASDGYLECSWDDDLNEMVFWLPDEKKEET